MRKQTISLLLIPMMLVGLPLAGTRFTNLPTRYFLEFPPLTRYVVHPDFSRAAFTAFTLINLTALALIAGVVARGHALAEPPVRRIRGPMPWWGWGGLVFGLAGWVMAWTRFGWMAPFQHHTFTLPWCGYIVFVNGWCVQRTGRCLILDAPRRFALLFPVSAAFWWFFEYLNRYVQNWYYVGVENFTPAEYVVFASIAFSTVLPAVLSTWRLLLSFHPLNAGLRRAPGMRLAFPRLIAIATWVVSGLGLMLIGRFPNLLFPLLWVSPLLILVAIQTLNGHPTVFARVADGDWREIVPPALAALACGFFWEMWNVNSLAKWKYSIPYVDCCRLFEMPILGYGGYLPFGIECLAFGRLVLGKASHPPMMPIETKEKESIK